MKSYFEKLAKSLFNSPFQDVSKPEQRVIQSIAEDTPIAECASRGSRRAK